MTQKIGPTDFYTRIFPVTKENVLYSDEDYAIAISKYEGKGCERLGIRWQKEAKGFPIARGNPAWMMIPDDMELAILLHLLKTKEEGKNEYSYQKTKEAMKVLLERG